MDRLSALFFRLGNSLDVEVVLSTLDEELRYLITYDALSMHLAEDSGRRTAYASCGASRALEWFETRAGEELMALASRKGHALQKDFRGEESGDVSALVFPVGHSPDDGLADVLVIQRSGRGSFSAEDAGILVAVSPKLAAALHNARTYRRAEQLAEADFATGLPNVRSLFHRMDAELARARRSRSALAVLHCSIEGLGSPTDFASQTAARHALQRVALKVRENCREYDFAACSPDSIILVLPDFQPENLAEKQELIQRIVEETGLDAGFPMFAAVGAAFYPEDGTDAEDLLAAAGRRVHIVHHSRPRG